MEQRRFDAVLIDFYGTICAGDAEAVNAVCRRIVDSCALPVTPGAFAVSWGKRFFQTVEVSNHDSFRTLHACVLASLRETLVEHGADIDPVACVAELEKYWTNPPIYADALEFLERTTLPVCCVSNADTQPLLAAIEKHGLRFAAVVSSEFARCYKPEAAIFHRALTTLGVDPRRVLHVGDSLHSDVSGAARLGITTAWLRRTSRIHDIGTCRADHVISKLNELTDLLC